MKYRLAFLFCSLLHLTASAQKQADTIIVLGSKLITLSTVVLDNKLNVPSFIEKIKNDSSFYKAFKNLRILNFSAINDIRMNDKKGNLNASLFSHTKQTVQNGCRTMQVIDEKISGDFYTESKDYNYYTAQMYASLFLPKAIFVEKKIL